MHKISSDNPVRRRLFAAEDDDSRVDNFVNTLQESTARDKVEKMKKWNFDFENDVPLEGTYKWYRVDDYKELFDMNSDWIGVKSNETDTSEDLSEEDEIFPIKLENEATPKPRNKESKNENPSIRKRKLSLTNSIDPAVRRKIDL